MPASVAAMRAFTSLVKGSAVNRIVPRSYLVPFQDRWLIR